MGEGFFRIYWNDTTSTKNTSFENYLIRNTNHIEYVLCWNKASIWVTYVE